jgi:hypothetical protein
MRVETGKLMVLDQKLTLSTRFSSLVMDAAVEPNRSPRRHAGIESHSGHDATD